MPSEEPAKVSAHRTTCLTLERQDVTFGKAFEMLQAAIAAHAFPAASLAVTFQEQLAALKALGRFTYDDDAAAVSEDTIFDLASVSKVVATTSMAMILYERGDLDLEMPVRNVIPEFSGEDVRRDEVTVRMLLGHCSGLPAYENLFERARTREQALHAAYQIPLAEEPGTIAAYSDIGFIILGEALARIADQPLDRFCQTYVFDPLGMARTSFCPARRASNSIAPTAEDRWFRHRLIQGEVHDENASVLGGVAGHAGVFATAADLARFGAALLKGRLVSTETLSVFTRRETKPPGTSRALGWDTPSRPSQSGRYFSPCSFGHLGFTGTSLWIDPERGLSVTLLTNRTWPDNRNQMIHQVRPSVHDRIIEALEGR
ncbi:MAG: beta-lactamase family protein [Acidobacteria bacterium]|nr:beta-lactamase family protein [Acidobacteriota bacterium]